MEIEKLFRRIPVFEDITLDTILFEGKYPVMFTCQNKGDIYLFICCLVNAEIVRWIGTKTDYDTLLGLLENRITIRDAFLNVTEEKLIIEYNGQKMDSRYIKSGDIPEALLPTVGEYMDAEEDEYEEEITVFKQRNANIEYKIQPQIHHFLTFQYIGKAIKLTDEFYNTEKELAGGMRFAIEKIQKRRVVSV